MRISDWSSDVCSSDRALYYTPSGKSIQGTGIEPDIRVEQPLPEELQGKVRDEGESSLRGHITGQNETEEGSGSAAYRSEERRVGKELSVSVDLGGRRIIKKKRQLHNITKKDTR